MYAGGRLLYAGSPQAYFARHKIPYLSFEIMDKVLTNSRGQTIAVKISLLVIGNTTLPKIPYPYNLIKQK